jgi:hypothetical protein
MVYKRQAIIEERPIDGTRHLRVICVGAGISGILTAIRFPQRIPNLELQIYEKNPDITGTWFEVSTLRQDPKHLSKSKRLILSRQNRYPGCACGAFPGFMGSQGLVADLRTRYPSTHIPADF